MSDDFPKHINKRNVASERKPQKWSMGAGWDGEFKNLILNTKPTYQKITEYLIYISSIVVVMFAFADGLSSSIDFVTKPMAVWGTIILILVGVVSFFGIKNFLWLYKDEEKIKKVTKFNSLYYLTLFGVMIALWIPVSLKGVFTSKQSSLSSELLAKYEEKVISETEYRIKCAQLENELSKCKEGISESTKEAAKILLVSAKNLMLKGSSAFLLEKYEEAAKWWQIIAEQGVIEAQLNLGFMYSKGLGVEQNYLMAFKWYYKAAEQGNANAQMELGVMYHEGDGVEQNFEKAAEWYEKAAIQGNSKAQFNLGGMCFSDKDFERAFRWFYEAAKQDHIQAYKNIGLMYYNGDGVEQSFEKAIGWYHKAATQGDLRVLTQLGYMYSTGEGVKQDYQKAYEWYHKAATQGRTVAQYNLGMLFYHGNGVNQDYKQAFEWFDQASKQGDINAQAQIGVMYYESQGVELNYDQAASYFLKSAKKGHSGAQNNLGLMYWRGDGIPQDFEIASKWFRRAAEQGNSNAKSALLSLKKEGLIK